ncbi:hypothetical protein [Micromonospora sp. C51]|nr:hypothetical protein [Micromonospora sp. C51]
MSPAADTAPPGHHRGLRAVVAAGAVSAFGYQANTRRRQLVNPG